MGTWLFPGVVLHKETRGLPSLANNGPRNIYGVTGFVSEVLGLQECKEISSTQNCPRDWNSNCHVFLTSWRYRIGKQPGRGITSTSLDVRNHLWGLLYSPHKIRPWRDSKVWRACDRTDAMASFFYFCGHWCLSFWMSCDLNLLD